MSHGKEFTNMSLVQFDAQDVREAVPMRHAINAVRTSFLDFAKGAFEMPLRTVLSDGQFLVMTAHHRPTRSAMVKTLSVNFETRTPSILGTVTWSNLDNRHQVVADAGAVTALRTGAVSGVATDLLAPATATTCTVIGAGAQGVDQARAVHAVRPLSELEIVDNDLARAETVCAHLADELGGHVTLRASTDANKAVEGKDLVCCATTSRTPLFDAEALAERAHVNAIGAFRPTMREVPVEALAGGLVVVDERQAVLEESGEIIDALEAGALRLTDLVELGTALQQPPVASGRTIFKSVGIAIQDWAIANLLAELVGDTERDHVGPQKTN
ncbi:MAG: ornithine cyclodeaminase family protein [Marmoricola sp.]